MRIRQTMENKSGATAGRRASPPTEPSVLPCYYLKLTPGLWDEVYELVFTGNTTAVSFCTLFKPSPRAKLDRAPELVLADHQLHSRTHFIYYELTRFNILDNLTTCGCYWEMFTSQDSGAMRYVTADSTVSPRNCVPWAMREASKQGLTKTANGNRP
ncbi:hypothetical protein BAUCODRAFT_298433 [Baudoinia panamericana UAMH 10762]|uniref:Uncharacterized protein n=1 Tax=Baudoinia panamericana (strain UAMH 10762) TaxID=717646 RepID=M2MZ40_BAUPA|nr:uncharacterized protein BAUCODRAFT_298433 [Baudoinia panamericana UAMH 10762]EMC91580.1 hypothetical protein BAUCODRAFT_298433 [Baudoinia panamericana UAMH 10762]